MLGFLLGLLVGAIVVGFSKQAQALAARLHAPL